MSRGWGMLGGDPGGPGGAAGGAGRAKLHPQTRTGCAGGRSGAQTHLALLDLHLIYLMPRVCSAIRRHQTLQGRGMDGESKQRLNINLPQGLKNAGGGRRGPVAFGVPLQVGGSPGDTPGRGGCSRLQDQIWLLSGSGDHSVPPALPVPAGGTKETPPAQLRISLYYLNPLCTTDRKKNKKTLLNPLRYENYKLCTWTAVSARVKGHGLWWRDSSPRPPPRG